MRWIRRAPCTCSSMDTNFIKKIQQLVEHIGIVISIGQNCKRPFPLYIIVLPKNRSRKGKKKKTFDQTKHKTMRQISSDLNQKWFEICLTVIWQSIVCSRILFSPEKLLDKRYCFSHLNIFPFCLCFILVAAKPGPFKARSNMKRSNLLIYTIIMHRIFNSKIYSFAFHCFTVNREKPDIDLTLFVGKWIRSYHWEVKETTNHFLYKRCV